MADSYWNSSDVQERTANFFDDESSATKMCGVSLGGTAKLSQQIKAGLGGIGTDKYSVDSLSGSLSGLVLKGDEEKVDLELHQLIPERTLQKILDADNEDYTFVTHNLTTEKEELRMLRRFYESRWSPPEIESVVTASLLGRPYSLEQYKSLRHKKDLLKAAETIGDGDLILNVILFLNRTLKKKLFHDILAGSPIVLQHYTNYLSTTKQISTLTDTLEMLGKTRDAAMKLYFEACTNPQRMLQRLRVCSRNHFTEPKDKLILDNFIKLLEWQEGYDNGKLLGASVATCLSDLCLNHWETPKTSPHSPSGFCQVHCVSDRLYQWAALIARSKKQAWPDLDVIFLTKGWLGGKKAKTDLPMEEVVSCMSKLGAPQPVLNTYLEFIDNLDKRLALAKKLQCHRSAIDTFIAQKDRLSLLSYKANLVPQSEDYVYAEQSLRNPFSDEDVRPPPTYNLHRRRNAFCVTSANAQLDDDWKVPPSSYLQKRRNAIYEMPSVAGDLIPEETRVLAYMKERGLKPYFPPERASQREDFVISSDEDEAYFSRRSDKSQQTSFVRKSTLVSKPEVPEDPTANWKAIADAEYKMKRKLPGFLKYQTPGYQRPIENAAPVYASTGTTTDGSSSTPRSGDTGMSTIQTSTGTRTRQTGTKPITAAPREKSDFRIM